MDVWPHYDGRVRARSWTRTHHQLIYLYPKTDHVAPHTQTSYAIALDPSGKICWERADITGDHIITVLTRKVSSDYLALCFNPSDLLSVWRARRLNSPRCSISSQPDFGIATLLLEGGGKINGSMLRAGLIDELSLLVAPVADGSSGSPALFDVLDSHTNDQPSARWKLRSMERRTDESCGYAT